MSRCTAHGLAIQRHSEIAIYPDHTSAACRPTTPYMTTTLDTDLPITFADVEAARARLAPYLPPTPLRHYPQLGDVVGQDVQIFVKHENHQPVNSFKIRNGLSFMTSLADDERRRGVVAASTGNHGQGIAYGGALLGVETTICVPEKNNPDKNAAMRALGATVVEEGRYYDEAIAVMLRIAAEQGRVVAHSTNDRRIIAGAATMTMEIVEQNPTLDALVIAVGGGSQAVGALTVARALAPGLEIYGVQAAGAPAIHDSWHAGERLTMPNADTFAEGVATRTTYDLTFPALLAGLTDFVTVTDAEIAESVRTILSLTHNLVEGAGAVGFAGARKLRDRLAGKRVGVVFSGGNIDSETLRRILAREM
jgi:threonine dehydratase